MKSKQFLRLANLTLIFSRALYTFFHSFLVKKSIQGSLEKHWNLHLRKALLIFSSKKYSFMFMKHLQLPNTTEFAQKICILWSPLCLWDPFAVKLLHTWLKHCGKRAQTQYEEVGPAVSTVVPLISWWRPLDRPVLLLVLLDFVVVWKNHSPEESRNEERGTMKDEQEGGIHPVKSSQVPDDVDQGDYLEV